MDDLTSGGFARVSTSSSCDVIDLRISFHQVIYVANRIIVPLQVLFPGLFVQKT